MYIQSKKYHPKVDLMFTFHDTVRPEQCQPVDNQPWWSSSSLMLLLGHESITSLRELLRHNITQICQIIKPLL